MPDPFTAARYHGRDGTERQVLVARSAAGHWCVMNAVGDDTVVVDTATGQDDRPDQAAALAGGDPAGDSAVTPIQASRSRRCPSGRSRSVPFWDDASVSNPVHVRRLRDGDREIWDELWCGYLRFYRADVSAAVSEATFARLRDEQDGMLGLVASDQDDRPIGLAHLVFHRSTWSATRYCYLEDLYVAPDARGREVARALFDAVYAAARDRGADRVYWQTQQYNGAARSLYDTVGRLTSFIVYEHDLGH
jgi:GNAT superfamily N-acetyltransferase